MGIEKFHNFLHRAEMKLSSIAANPLIGTLGGTGTVLLGTVQLTAGIACGIIFSLANLVTDSRFDFLDQGTEECLSQMGHGSMNILVGVAEAIPGMGTFIWDIRMESMNRFYINPNETKTFGEIKKCNIPLQPHPYWAYDKQTDSFARDLYTFRIAKKRGSEIVIRPSYYGYFSDEVATAFWRKEVKKLILPKPI